MNSQRVKLEHIDEQASEWFVLMSSEDVTDKEKCAFQEWFNASPLHRRAFQDFAVLWESMTVIPEAVYDKGHASHARAKGVSASSDHGLAQNNVIQIQRWFRSVQHYAAAAVVVLAFAMFYFIQADDQATVESIAYFTDVGEVKTLDLEDGSQITLSAKSRIVVTLEENQRRVLLTRGQAFFDIAKRTDKHGKKIPFHVQVGELSVHVLGTQFDIRRLKNQVDVAVLEGKVKVESDLSGEHAYLTEGKTVVAIGEAYDSLSAVTNIDTSVVSSWRKGRLTYRNAYLTEVISDANRFHSGQIILGNDSLADLRVTTSFSVDQIAEMTMMLQEILPVSVYQQSRNNIIIMPRDD